MMGPSSLISRFAASTAILAAAILLLAFFSFNAIRGNIFEDSFESPLDEWSSYLAGRIGEDPEIAQFAARSHQMGVVLTTREGVFAFGTDGSPTTPEHLAEHHASVRTIIVEGHGGVQYSFYLRDSAVAVVDNSLLWALIGGLLLLIGVVYIVQLSQLKPLRWLKEGVDKVSEGDLSTRVPVVRMDEIGQVGRAFNHMTSRVEQMLNDHDRLMADVSHELRSPLARIKVALEMLPEGDKREQIAADIREMEALTSALLERERIKSRASQANYATFDLVAVTRRVIDGLEGSEPGIELKQSPDTLMLDADEALIKVLLQNLMDNAIKFSLDDSTAVEVRLMHDGDDVSIEIGDDGRGIPEDMTGRVLEPFVKL
ncbi:MAG: HAMP domain-containing protein, partial [Woeseiaceae bacterium]|nr:HAMP domain-containing protein [Woeseiaceae bacterium]